MLVRDQQRTKNSDEIELAITKELRMHITWSGRRVTIYDDNNYISCYVDTLDGLDVENAVLQGDDTIVVTTKRDVFVFKKVTSGFIHSSTTPRF